MKRFFLSSQTPLSHSRNFSMLVGQTTIFKKMDGFWYFLQATIFISTLVKFVCCQPEIKDYPTETQNGNVLQQAFQSPPSPLAQNEKLANMGKTDEEDFPEGFEIVDGIVMDISNVMVQFVVGNATEYRFYQSKRPLNAHGDFVVYRRPKVEEGWHFILFEDPLEIPGSGHLVLLQKLLGLSVEVGMGNMLNRREFRLYEAYHVDLSAEIGEVGLEADADAMGNTDVGGKPYDNVVGKLEPTIGDQEKTIGKLTQ